MKYVALLRGINVGGKNKIPMAELKFSLKEAGFRDVSTYIQSGNVILQSDLDGPATSRKIEALLSSKFRLDSSIIKVVCLTPDQLQAVIDKKPAGFGEQPDMYHCDVIFLLDIDAAEAFEVFDPREGVDQVWQGQGVIYSQRLSSQRTKSRLSKIMMSPLYKSMTIRNWNTVTKLHDLLQSR